MRFGVFLKQNSLFSVWKLVSKLVYFRGKKRENVNVCCYFKVTQGFKVIGSKPVIYYQCAFIFFIYFLNISQVSDKFAFSLFDLDWDVFMQHIEGAVNRVPALEQTGIKSTVCGPGTHTHTHTHMLSCVPITSWGITFTEVISWRLYLQPPNTNPSTNLKLKVYMLRCRYMCLTLQGFDLCP